MDNNSILVIPKERHIAEATPMFDFSTVAYTQNEDGSLNIKIEDAAEKLGLVKVSQKNGKEYRNVRLDRINKYSQEFGISHTWEKEEYIPENFFYWLTFKVENEQTKGFRKQMAFALRDLRIRVYLENAKKADSKEILQLEEDFRTTELILETITSKAQSISVRKMAKLISSEGRVINERGLRELLKKWDILIQNGKEPTQRAIDRGILEYSYSNKNKNPSILITQKGQLYLLKRIFRPRANSHF